MTAIASGDPLSFIPIDPPPNITRDATTNIPYAAFNAATDELVYWVIHVPDGWTTGGQNLHIRWRAATATTGNVVWSARIAALSADDAQDTDTDLGFATGRTVTDAAPGTAGYQTVALIDFTAAQADTMAADDYMVVEISRDADNASDTMAGDAEILDQWWDDAG